MPLYTCPGCKKPIAESQPLDHCLQCEAMNERQRARNRTRASSASESTEAVVECTIVTITLRRRSQQYGNAARASGSPPSYEDVFQWEAEASAAENRPPQQQETSGMPRRAAATATIPIHTKKA
ncbi:hypothetical protein A9K55_008719 [Cordyceps militaris]|uniref:Uncharacterized protein n=1 Tax=Cordyceps militaris TaxID=73501 RepID=A0A2H4SHS1_CORMI|nr:hypothetical protein A9K55_008719 [Cordyceps militaris]